jgi:class 3 adenylate cyclase/predicted Ser/Thr protein kinase
MSDSERPPAAPDVVDATGPTLPPVTLPSAASGADDLAGSLLAGRYRLERVLGRGGMGAVYKADHLALGVKVAVKVMHAAFGGSVGAERRFAREAHATSLLAHRNVVRVLDYGKSEALHFIVMELLEGESLAAWLDRKEAPPPLAEVADLVRQIADALAAAHDAGVVHRDLKPDNVFLSTESGGSRVVKVVDFGLAHVEEDNPEGTLTRADAVAGTPYYMSPEQCRSLKVGASTDLYALGCILTELLQLAPPFEGGAPAEIIARQMFAPPPPLRRPEGAEPVPPLLERLRLDSLAKTPEARPASAAIFRDRLDQALDPARASAVLPGRTGTPRRAEPTAPPSRAVEPGAGGAVRMALAPRATAPVRGRLSGGRRRAVRGRARRGRRRRCPRMARLAGGQRARARVRRAVLRVRPRPARRRGCGGRAHRPAVSLRDRAAPPPPLQAIDASMRIRTKAALLFTVVAAIPVALPLPFVLPAYARALRTSAEQYQLVVAKEVKDKVDDHVAQTRLDADTLAAAIGKGATAKDDGAALGAIDVVLATRPSFDVARIVIPSREVDTVLGKPGADRAAAPLATQGLLAAAREAGVGFEVLDAHRAALAVPIPGEPGAPEGFLIVPVYLAAIQLDLEDVATSRQLAGAKTTVLVVDRSRHVIAAVGEQAARVGADVATHPVWRLVPDGTPTTHEVGVTGSYGDDAERTVATVQTLEGTGWAVGIVRPESDALADYQATRRSLVGAAAIALAFALVLALTSARAIAKPVLLLVERARLIGRRDWAHVKADSGRGDEIGELDRAMVTMATDLEQKERELAAEIKLRADLARFVSPEIVDGIVRGEHDLALGGRRAEVTVLFADVVAFTPLAEKRPAEEVVQILNELFTLLTEIVFRHGGMVDKFVGDSVMAVFGAPVPAADHAARALRTAEDIMRLLDTAAEAWRRERGTEIRLAIGINTGQAIVGNIGSERRMEYTAIGDAVNVAARLESMAAPNQVLVGAATAEKVGEAFALERLGPRKLPGREEEVVVYELVP